MQKQWFLSCEELAGVRLGLSHVTNSVGCKRPAGNPCPLLISTEFICQGYIDAPAAKNFSAIPWGRCKTPKRKALAQIPLIGD